MSLRYYSANATLSTISTTSFSQTSTIDSIKQAKQTMKQDKKNLKNSESSPKVEKKEPSSSNTDYIKKVPISKLSLLAIALTLGLGGFIFYHGHEQIEKQKNVIDSLKTEIANLKQTTKKSIIDDVENNINQSVNLQKQQFSSLEQRVNDQLSEQQQQQQQLINQINDTIKINQQNFHNFNERLSAMSTMDSNVWLISQANYFVNLAARKIWNDQDYTTARILLKNADESLAQTNDPSLTLARQAINKDINSLSQVSFIDSDGIIIKLINLSDSLTQLPLLGHYKEIDMGLSQDANSHNSNLSGNSSAEAAVHSDDGLNEKDSESNRNDNQVTPSLSDWSDNLMSNANSFVKKFISIEKLDNSDNTFSTCITQAGKDEKQIAKCHILKTPLSLEQSFYLRENIRFRLLIAAQAVPRHQDQIYQRSLNDVALWVNAYFDTNAPSVKAFLNDIDKLQKQSISNQNVPETLASIGELNKLMQTRVRSMLAK